MAHRELILCGHIYTFFINPLLCDIIRSDYERQRSAHSNAPITASSKFAVYKLYST